MQQPNSEKPKIYYLDKLSIYRPDRGRLQWAFRKGYPRLVVITDMNKDDPSIPFIDTIITAPFTPETFRVFIDKLKQALTFNNGEKETIICFNSEWVDGKPTNEVIKQATVIYGKDEDGIMWISAVKDNMPNMKFRLFLNSKYHKYYKRDGSEYNNSELSIAYARAYIQNVEAAMGKLILDTINTETRVYDPNNKNKDIGANLYNDDI